MKLRKTLQKQWIVPALAVGLPLLFTSATQAQDTSDQDEQQRKLEARIEQLERQLRELTEKMSSAPEPVAAAKPSSPDATVIQAKTITPNAVPGTRFLY